MKNTICFVILAILISSCGKDEKPTCDIVTITAPANEIAALRTYIDTNNIVVTADPRGFFYKINTPGTGDKPTACSNVTVAYVGRLLNGNIFDQNTGLAFNLSELIAGWQEALPLIAKGGSMTLYLPPTLGYGPNAVGSVPANSNLIFDISLK